MNNFLSTPGPSFEDESFYLFYMDDYEEDINRQLGLHDREFVFMVDSPQFY